jgi:hypothetical protein
MRLRRSFSSIALGAAFASAAACSAAPDGEKSVTTTAALDPNQVALPTGYTVTLSAVTVVQAQEPNQAPPPLSGFYSAATGESCTTIGGDDNTAKYWTPDTGFVDAAQLGVKISSTVAGSIPFQDGNPLSYGCVLGSPQGNGQLSTSAQTGAVLTVCGQNAFQDALVGDTLAVNFTVNPGDQVHLALALDNVEQTQISALQSNMSGNTTEDIKIFGDVAMLTGTAIATGSGLGVVGGLIGVVGNTSGLEADLLASSPSSSCSVDCEAENASSCTGGLMGGPTGYTPVNVGPVAGDCWNDLVGYSPTVNVPTCEYTGGPPDTIRIVDPTTGSDLTAERLQQMTAAGPATFEFTPSYNENSNTCMMAARHGGTVAPPWSQPMFMSGCASTLKIDVTISRDWSTGLAASARSADMAVVRTPTTLDTFNVDPTDPTHIRHRYGEGTSFTSEDEAPAEATQALGVSLSTAPVVVSRTTNNLDAYWVDSLGGMYTVYQQGPDFTWHTENIFAPGFPVTIGRYNTFLDGILPGNAAMTAVARSPLNLDVFALGYDGNVYTSYWNSGSGTNSQGLATWAKPFATTTGTCIANPNTACAGSGAPGGPIASVSKWDGQIDVFYIGKDGGVWTSWWNYSSPWTTMEIYGPSSVFQNGPGIASPGAGITAVAPTPNNLDVFFIDTQGNLRASTWSPQGSWSTGLIQQGAGTGLPSAPVSAVARQPSVLDVIYQGPDSTLRWATSTNGTWNVSTVPTTGGGSLGSSFAPGNVSLVAPSSFALQAFYLDSAHKLNTLTWTDPCNSILDQGCALPSQDYTWSNATLLSPSLKICRGPSCP